MEGNRRAVIMLIIFYALVNITGFLPDLISPERDGSHSLNRDEMFICSSARLREP